MDCLMSNKLTLKLEDKIIHLFYPSFFVPTVIVLPHLDGLILKTIIGLYASTGTGLP